MKATLIWLLTLAAALGGCLADEGSDDRDDPDGPGSPPDEGPPGGTRNETTDPAAEATLTWTTGATGCPRVVFTNALDGIDSGYLGLAAGLQGLPFNITYETSAPAVMYGVSFGAGGAVVEEFTAEEPAVHGTIPAEAEEAYLWTCGGAEVTATFTASAA